MPNFKLILVEFLQEKFNLKVDKGLDTFISALTHKSYKNIDPASSDYERLETLGDSFISLIVTQNLYLELEQVKEICSTRKEIVSGTSLSWIAKDLELQKCIRLGKGCNVTDSILEDIYEALIGACYLEAGFEKTKEIVEETLYKSYKEGKLIFSIDYKTQLQEWAQANFPKKRVNYVLDSHLKSNLSREYFLVSVKYENEVLGQGKGFKRKEAEQNAAKQALIKLKVLRSI